MRQTKAPVSMSIAAAVSVTSSAVPGFVAVRCATTSKGPAPS